MAILIFTEGPLAGRRVAFDEELSIGRAYGDLLIDDPDLSRRHVRLRRVHDGVEVEDLGSLNGSYVDGVRVDGPTALRPGAELTLGASRARLAPARTADPHVAMAEALTRTRPAIVSSGVTVAAAMLTFYAATLRADRVIAPVNAIGILVVMLAGVTLLPALMTILGRRGFWPSGRAVAHQTKAAAGAGTGSAIGRRPGLWLRVGGVVQAHPGPALVRSLSILAAGAVGLVTFTEKVSILNDFRVSTDATRGLAL